MLVSLKLSVLQGSSGGGGLAQRLVQQRPADWTSVRPAVPAAELREESLPVVDGRAELETDPPGQSPRGPDPPVGDVSDGTDQLASVCACLTAVCVSVSHMEQVAELSYLATLEDLGLVKATEVIVSESSQVRR